MDFKKLFILSTFLFFAVAVHAQNVISGIVVDSISLTALPGVFIKVKNSNKGTESNLNGSFLIVASDFDTLVFSSVGYFSFEYPLLGPEADILIRMKASIRMLSEVTVTAEEVEEPVMVKRPPRYIASDGSTYTRSPTPNLAIGISSPFTYFSKTEREKRKLIKMRTENKKVKTFVDIVNDPLFKNEILKKFSLKEKDYYELLARFNQQNKEAVYIKDPEIIKQQLVSFIKNNIRK